jgi:hypothetical protein
VFDEVQQLIVVQRLFQDRGDPELAGAAEKVG